MGLKKFWPADNVWEKPKKPERPELKKPPTIWRRESHKPTV